MCCGATVADMVAVDPYDEKMLEAVAKRLEAAHGIADKADAVAADVLAFGFEAADTRPLYWQPTYRKGDIDSRPNEEFGHWDSDEEWREVE